MNDNWEFYLRKGQFTHAEKVDVLTSHISEYMCSGGIFITVWKFKLIWIVKSACYIYAYILIYK